MTRPVRPTASTPGDPAVPLPPLAGGFAQPNAPGDPPCVLVAEPDGDAAFILAAWLERRGYRVMLATTAAAAVRCAAERQVDVALLSGRLPDMSLGELAQRLRTQAWPIDLRIIGTADEAPAPEDAFDATLRLPLTAHALDEALGN